MFVIRAHPPPQPPPRFGKFSSTARWKALQSLYCTIRRLFVLFVNYSRTIRTIRRLFADYSYYSSTIRGLFVLFVDYSHYSHYSFHYSSFINRSFSLTSRRPYWCTKTIKWRPYWCTVRELALSSSNISYCFTTPLGPPIT